MSSNTKEYNRQYYENTLKPRRTKMKALEENNAELRREILFLKSRVQILERKLEEERFSVKLLAGRIFN